MLKPKSCKRCGHEYSAEAHHTLYCAPCRPIAHKAKMARGTRKYNQKARLEALRMYSPDGIPACGCCGESIVEFLTLDHIHNDGYTLRKAGINGSAIGPWLRHNGYPAGFQVLCFNCNCARGQQPDKICPHQKLHGKSSGIK